MYIARTVLLLTIAMTIIPLSDTYTIRRRSVKSDVAHITSLKPLQLKGPLERSHPPGVGSKSENSRSLAKKISAQNRIYYLGRGSFNLRNKNAENYYRPGRRKRRNSRQITGSPTYRIVNFAIDFLMRTIKPYLGKRGVVLVELARPLLVHMGTSVFSNGFELLKNMVTQGTFLDPALFRMNPYAAYPVFIPGYGSYILLSDSGSFDLPNMTLRMNEAKLENNKNSTSSDTSKETEKSSPSNDDKEDNTSAEDTESDDSKTSNASGEVNKSDAPENAIESKIDELNGVAYFLGHSHLIPIMNRPMVFESTKEIDEADWSAETDEKVRESVKRIVNSGTTIISFKKRVLLNVLKQLERTIMDS